MTTLAIGLQELTAEALAEPDVAVEDLRRLTTGASLETWSFRARLSGGRDRKLIFRRDPPTGIQPGRIAREAVAMSAVARVGVPVPAVLAIEETPDRLGAPFILMEHVEGETRGSRIVRHEGFAAVRSRLAEQCGQILARLHSLSPEEAPDLPVVDALTELRRALDGFASSAAFELAYRWLEERRPASSEPSVVHGDFRNGNLVIGADGVRSVLDWELVHIGDPMEDLGWLCVRAWRFGGAGVVGGFGSCEALLAAYVEAGGRPVDMTTLHWWQVLATVRWGVFCLMQARRHLTGRERSIELLAIGLRVHEQEYDALSLLRGVTEGS